MKKLTDIKDFDCLNYTSVISCCDRKYKKHDKFKYSLKKIVRVEYGSFPYCLFLQYAYRFKELSVWFAHYASNRNGRST